VILRVQREQERRRAEVETERNTRRVKIGKEAVLETERERGLGPEKGNLRREEGQDQEKPKARDGIPEVIVKMQTIVETREGLWIRTKSRPGWKWR